MTTFSTGQLILFHKNNSNTGNSRCLTRRWLTLSDCSRSTLGSQKIFIYFQCHGHGPRNSSKVEGWGLCQLQFTPSTCMGGIILWFLCDQTSNILEFHSFLKGVSLKYAVCHAVFVYMLTDAVLHLSFPPFSKCCWNRTLESLCQNYVLRIGHFWRIFL